MVWFYILVGFKFRSSPTSAVLSRVSLTVQTNLSVRPFDWGFLGEDLMCSICHSQVKSWNSLEVYYVPPSEMIVLGIPYSGKIDLNCVISLGGDIGDLSDNWELTIVVYYK